MPAQWTGVIIGQMHTNEITAKQLAEEVGWNPKYLSQVLNSRVHPKNAEEKLTAALERIKQSRDCGMPVTTQDAVAAQGGS